MAPKALARLKWDAVPLMDQPPQAPAGSKFSYTVPTGFEMIVYAATFTLTTDATVATRFMQNECGWVYAYPTGGAIGKWLGQQASRTNTFALHIGVPVSDLMNQLYRQGTMVKPLLLQEGEYFRVAGNVQAGDQMWMTLVAKQRPTS